MKVLVCGSRTILDYELVCTKLNKLNPTMIIHGGAKGPDTIASWWAAQNHIDQRMFLPNWDLYGRHAGILRNNQMLDTNPDLVLAFWDGRSRGTKHTITEARKRGIPTEVIYGGFDGPARESDSSD